ncbi:MAG TPA: hypothetical protein VED85_01185 [Burkholderiaceae bacterium]|nr:hypothetical protein [Burkholderiaceae bacterium]
MDGDEDRWFPSILRIERWHSALIVEVKDAVDPWRAPQWVLDARARV